MEGSEFILGGKGERHGVPKSHRNARSVAPARNANLRAVRAIGMASSERESYRIWALAFI